MERMFRETVANITLSFRDIIYVKRTQSCHKAIKLIRVSWPTINWQKHVSLPIFYIEMTHFFTKGNAYFYQIDGCSYHLERDQQLPLAIVIVLVLFQIK